MTDSSSKESTFFFFSHPSFNILFFSLQNLYRFLPLLAEKKNLPILHNIKGLNNLLPLSPLSLIPRPVLY
jgi:hypothetical protein